MSIERSRNRQPPFPWGVYAADAAAAYNQRVPDLSTTRILLPYVETASSLGGVSPDLVEPNFTNLTERLPREERYTFIFEGTPQALDHVLVNTVADSYVTRYVIVRKNADFPSLPPALFAANVSRPERNSDHDMPVAYLTLPTDLELLHEVAAVLRTLTASPHAEVANRAFAALSEINHAIDQLRRLPQSARAPRAHVANASTIISEMHALALIDERTKRALLDRLALVF